jgi:hypothetical protein
MQSGDFAKAAACVKFFYAHSRRSEIIQLTNDAFPLAARRLSSSRSRPDAKELLAYRYKQPSSTKCEAQDALFIRILYAHACVISNAQKREEGKGLIEGVKRAIAQVLKGIQCAKRSARYAYLVYNGSVHFWHVAHPLMRDGYWQHIQESLAEVYNAVKELEGHSVWKARLASAMAMSSAAVRHRDPE